MRSVGRRTQRPALQALLILIAALVLALTLAEGVEQGLGVRLPIAVFVILQGGIAALLAYMCRMAWWWSAMLAVFPIAALLVNYLQLPPLFFLAAFLIMLVVFWTTFRSQVPYYPSRLSVWQAVEPLLPANRPFRFIDIGSGFGGAVMYLSKGHAQGEFTGIEIAPLPWLISLLRAKMRGSRGRFVRGDYTRLDFAQYDVVFAYLSPAAMPGLWEKAASEMAKGSLLLSYEFIIEQKKPDILIQTQENGATLYGWNM